MATFIYPSTQVSVPGVATEATQLQVLAEVTAINSNTADVATETTLAALAAEDFATETTLASLDAKDFATETTLAALAAEDFATETTLAALAAEDFATETTLAAVSVDVQQLVDKLPAGLVPEAFDELVIAYVGATTDISSVTYKLASATVAVLTLSYDGQNRLSGVVKS